MKLIKRFVDYITESSNEEVDPAQLELWAMLLTGGC